ncbi:hypothetical protein ACF1BU_35155 [Streptomyces sp. NPDC014724]|uniref:hypothetical protein n=1 Tax=Actinomycetes TaxID=1760 RepID=UPI000B1D390B|nr:hypothetical protein [Nocardia farcinica]PFW99067.1 hypothetical protein CJ469_05667 [Nocardia farcinica]PFX06105.1 hypothetical protein CJ468_04965 [Nocardia farcinica]
MAKIRADLEGVVYAFRASGETVVLKAGDEIPADIALGSHLVDSGKSAPKPVEPTAEPAENKAQPRRGRPRNASAVNDATSDEK